jgi:O-palmitoleoyl-L-serine hydrolase
VSGGTPPASPPATAWPPAGNVLDQAAGSDGVLPAGFPPAPANIPLLKWADKYWFDILGAPGPANMPPAPDNLSPGQWAANYVFEQQQLSEQAAQQAAQLEGKVHGATAAVAGAPLPGTGPGVSVLGLHSLASVDPLAVCNDGSPAGFYYSAGSDPSTWLVFLQGGDWCWDAQSCAVRGAAGTTSGQVSSLGWPATVSLGGVFDSNALENPFATANKIFVPYCSSDSWIGDVSAAQTEAVYGFAWSFRGRRILAAALNLLSSQLGLGAAAMGASSATPHRLLLGGCSAGARGAMFNLDAVAGHAPGSVSVQGLLDSPLWINTQPINQNIPSLESQCADALSLFDAGDVLNAGCVNGLASGASPSLCLMGQYLMPYINTSYFLNAGQFDAFQLPYDLGG